MIGIWATYSNIFLYAVGAVSLIAFGLPLMLVPLGWAKVFGWKIGGAGELTVFLGRSLGFLIALIAVFAFIVVSTLAAKPFFFNMMIFLTGGMAHLHGYAAIRKVLPKMEQLEIIVWVALFILAFCFYPV